MAINGIGSVSTRINLAPRTIEPAGSIAGVTRRGFLTNLLGSTMLVTALKIGLPVASALGAIGCGSQTANVQCTNTVSLFDADGKINRNLMKTANMYISNGKVRFSVDLDIPADGSIGSLDETALGGNLYLRLFSSPGLIGADADGKLAIRNSSDGDFGTCSTDVKSCSPFVGLYGMVPVAFVQRVKLPADVAPGTDAANEYAVGGKMLLEVGGDGLYAVLSRMNVYVTENGAKVYKPVWLSGSDLVVEEKCTSEDLDNPCTSTVKYYRVDPTGVVTAEEVFGVDKSKLVEAFGYYQITPAGKYMAKNTDGSPMADPTLAARDFEMLKDPDTTLADLISGNSAKSIGGLAVGPDGKLDLSLLKDQQLALGADITVADLRSPSVGSNGIATNAQLAAEADAYDYKLPRAIYSNGQFKFRVHIDFAGDNMTLPQVEYFYTFAANAKIILKDVPPGTCE